MIRPATPDGVPVIAQLIRELAEYERLAHVVVLEEQRLREHLFGPRPYAEVLPAEEAGEVIGFALFFPNYSTFLGRPGIYLEDLFIRPERRGRGHGVASQRRSVHRAERAANARLRAAMWSGVVPQQPPTIRAPSSTHCHASAAYSSGGYSPVNSHSGGS